MKGAGKSPRRPLSEIQVSSARVSLPEIPVKVNESGHLVVDSVENKEIATQTTQPLVVTSEKVKTNTLNWVRVGPAHIYVLVVDSIKWTTTLFKTQDMILISHVLY